MADGGSKRLDWNRRQAPQSTNEKAPFRRSRILPNVRRQIINAVIEGRYNGAEAARAYAVSEASVHRLVKAELLANPDRIVAARGRAQSRSHAPTLAKVDPDRYGRRALTATQQQEVVERLYTGTDIGTDLAREFGVHKSTISRILRAAKTQFPFRPIIEPDPLRRQNRIVDGIARAQADGRRIKSKLSEDIQESILIAAVRDGASLISIAIKYDVNPSIIARIVNARRVRPPPDNPQSLEDIFSDLLGG